MTYDRLVSCPSIPPAHNEPRRLWSILRSSGKREWRPTLTEDVATEEPAPGDRSGRPNRSFRSAVKWSFVMDGGRQALTTMVTFILARQLGPEVYGIAGLALLYVLFVTMIQRQGIVAAIVQRDDLSSKHLDSAFWAQISLSLMLTALSILLSGWYAGLNKTEDLRLVIIALSSMIPLHGLTLVQDAIVRRDLDFKTLALRTNLSVIVAGLVAIAMALLGAGVWAIVVQQILSAAVGVLVLWGLSDWRPGFRFSTEALTDLLAFSVPSFLGALASFAYTQADSLLLGVLFGPAAVGLYRFAVRLVDIVTTVTSRALAGAALPELSRYQDDHDRFGERVMLVVRLSAILSMPAMGLLAAGSDDVIALVGEARWGPASVVLRVMCVAGVVRALTLIVGPMLQAIGRPWLFAGVSWMSAAVTLAGLATAGYLLREAVEADQVTGMAKTRALISVTFILALPIALTHYLFGIGPKRWAGALFPAAMSSIAAYVASVGVGTASGLEFGFVRLLLGGTAGVLAAVVVLWFSASEFKSAVLDVAQGRSR